MDWFKVQNNKQVSGPASVCFACNPLGDLKIASRGGGLENRSAPAPLFYVYGGKKCWGCKKFFGLPRGKFFSLPYVYARANARWNHLLHQTRGGGGALRDKNCGYQCTTPFPTCVM